MWYQTPNGRTRPRPAPRRRPPRRGRAKRPDAAEEIPLRAGLRHPRGEDRRGSPPGLQASQELGREPDDLRPGHGRDERRGARAAAAHVPSAAEDDLPVVALRKQRHLPGHPADPPPVPAQALPVQGTDQLGQRSPRPLNGTVYVSAAQKRKHFAYFSERSTRTISLSLRANTLFMANAGCDQIDMRVPTLRVGPTSFARLSSSYPSGVRAAM